MQLPVWLSNLLDGGWPLWTIVAALAAIGLPLLLWSLFADRSRGRRRCPRCWYDLRGTPGLRCSECGFEARHERALFKSRRRWKWAAVGAFTLIASASLLTAPKVRRDGWPSLVPTTVLLWIDARDAANDAGRQAVASPRWVERELIRRDAALQMTGDVWLRYLSSTNAIRTRKLWPATIPLSVSIVLPDWANSDLLARRPGSGDWAIFGNQSIIAIQVHSQSSAAKWVKEVGFVDARESPVELSCEVRSASMFGWQTGKFHSNSANFAVELPVTIVPHLHDAIPPASGTDIDTLMLRALSPTIVSGTNTKGGIDSFALSFRRSIDPRVKPIAFGFFVDILLGDELIHAFSMVPPNPPDGGDDEGTTVLLSFYRWNELKLRLRAEPSTIRITGNAILGLRDWDRTHYWAGSLEYNLHDAFRDE